MRGLSQDGTEGSVARDPEDLQPSCRTTFPGLHLLPGLFTARACLFHPPLPPFAMQIGLNTFPTLEYRLGGISRSMAIPLTNYKY